MATRVEQAQLTSGAIRNKPITAELVSILDAAAVRAGVDRVVVGSGGQPAAPGTPRKGSPRHDNGRAADFKLYQGGKALTFTDAAAPPAVVRFITECARFGATGIGASVKYMGPETFHVGFGLSPSDQSRVVWGGAKATSAGAPKWLRDACVAGWAAPAPLPRTVPPLTRPAPVEPPAPSQPASASPAGTVATIGGIIAGGALAGGSAGSGSMFWIGVTVFVIALVVGAAFVIRHRR